MGPVLIAGSLIAAGAVGGFLVGRGFRRAAPQDATVERRRIRLHPARQTDAYLVPISELGRREDRFTD